jgi:hypothetical protein
METFDSFADEAARKQRLKACYEGKACARCGETNAEMLGGYSRIDLHHLAGRAHDPDLVVYYCRNCHAVAAAQLKEVGVVDLSAKPNRNLLEVIATVLRAMGRTLKDWGELLLEYGERLFAYIEALDALDPSWRDLPEVQL